MLAHACVISYHISITELDRPAPHGQKYISNLNWIYLFVSPSLDWLVHLLIESWYDRPHIETEESNLKREAT